jgi:tetratricopeptide (TPR) repeat protein
MNNQYDTLKENAFEAYKKKDYLTASQSFRECIQLSEELGKNLDASEMRNNLSVVLLELKQYDEALSVLDGTAEAFAKAGDRKRQAMALGNKAAVLQAKGELTAALELYETSSALFKEAGEKEMRAITLKKISDLQMKTGKQYQALASLEASYDQNEKRSIKERILKSFLGTLIGKITHRS